MIDVIDQIVHHIFVENDRIQRSLPLLCSNKRHSLTKRIALCLHSSKIDSSLTGRHVDKCFAFVGQQRCVTGLFEHFNVDLSILSEDRQLNQFSRHT